MPFFGDLAKERVNKINNYYISPFVQSNHEICPL